MTDKSSPIELITSMIVHAITVSGNNRQTLLVVLAVMIHVIHDLPGDNEPLVKWVEQTIKMLNKLNA